MTNTLSSIVSGQSEPVDFINVIYVTYGITFHFLLHEWWGVFRRPSTFETMSYT